MIAPGHQRALFGILAVALLLRVAALWLAVPAIGSDAKDYRDLALSLAGGRGYTIEGTPTAYRNPGYPFFAAAIFAIAGPHTLPVFLFQVILDVGTCWLVFLLAARLAGMDAGFLAAALYAFFPTQVLYAGAFMTESLFTFLFTAALWLIVCGSPEAGMRGSFLVGLAIGVAVLVRSTAAILLLVVLVDGIGRGRPRRRLIGELSVVVAGMVLVLAPWVARNEMVFHRVALSSNMGVNLWIGNHPGANGSYTASTAGSLDGAEGEFARSDRGVSEAVSFIVRDPRDAAVLVARKWAHFFSTDYALALSFHPPTEYQEARGARAIFSQVPGWIRWALQLPFMVVAVLAAFTLISGGAADRHVLRVTTTTILVWLLAHLVFFASGRHRVPIVPLILVLAAHAWRDRHGWWSIAPIRTKVAFVAVVLVFVGGWIAEELALRGVVLAR